MNKTIPEDNSSSNKNSDLKRKYTQVESTQSGNEIEPDRVIAGFLVSFSASSSGTYWVLYEGRNRIGSNSTNDIVINDANVSSNHAILNIRHSVNDGRMLVAISDQNSSNGTIVNNKDIEFSTCELNSQDVIKIGNYELGILYIDRVGKNLKANENIKSSTSPISKQYTSPYDISVKSNTSKRTKPE